MTIPSVIVGALITTVFAWKLLQYIYGKDWTQWHSILFSERDTYRSIFLPKGKGLLTRDRDKNQ